MLHIKNNKKTILELFFDFPNENFHLRQISRKTKIAITSVRNYLRELLQEKLVVQVHSGIYPCFKSNRDDDDGIFKFYKKLNLLERLHSSGLIDFIFDNCSPNSIILYGSGSKGEDIESSDIDIFVESPEKKLDLKRFEKLLNREIHVLFKSDFSKLDSGLKNNILNGIILKGYVDVC